MIGPIPPPTPPRRASRLSRFDVSDDSLVVAEQRLRDDDLTPGKAMRAVAALRIIALSPVGVSEAQIARAARPFGALLPVDRRDTLECMRRVGLITGRHAECGRRGHVLTLWTLADNAPPLALRPEVSP